MKIKLVINEIYASVTELIILLFALALIWPPPPPVVMRAASRDHYDLQDEGHMAEGGSQNSTAIMAT